MGLEESLRDEQFREHSATELRIIPWARALWQSAQSARREVKHPAVARGFVRFEPPAQSDNQGRCRGQVRDDHAADSLELAKARIRAGTIDAVAVDKFREGGAMPRGGSSRFSWLTFGILSLVYALDVPALDQSDGDPDLVEAEIVSFGVEAGLGDETLGGVLVRPVDAVDLTSGNLVFAAFPDTILEDIDAFHRLPSGDVVFSTSTDVTQGFGGLALFGNGDLVRWDGFEATLLFSEAAGFGTTADDIDAFSVLPNGNWVLSTSLTATLGGLTFENGDIVEYDPESDVATLYMGLDEAAVFTGSPSQSNADIDALEVLADGTVIFSIRSDGVGRIGTTRRAATCSGWIRTPGKPTCSPTAMHSSMAQRATSMRSSCPMP
jgi:hypothetical protein